MADELPTPNPLQYNPFENDGETRKSCATNLDCIEEYELCIKGICANIRESTGLEAWQVGSIVIGALLFIGTIAGCLMLHPNSSCSKRYAHPKDKRIYKVEENEAKTKDKAKKFDREEYEMSIISDVLRLNKGVNNEAFEEKSISSPNKEDDEDVVVDVLHVLILSPSPPSEKRNSVISIESTAF